MKLTVGPNEFDIKLTYFWVCLAGVVLSSILLESLSLAFAFGEAYVVAAVQHLPSYAQPDLILTAARYSSALSLLSPVVLAVFAMYAAKWLKVWELPKLKNIAATFSIMLFAFFALMHLVVFAYEVITVRSPGYFGLDPVAMHLEELPHYLLAGGILHSLIGAALLYIFLFIFYNFKEAKARLLKPVSILAASIVLVLVLLYLRDATGRTLPLLDIIVSPFPSPLETLFYAPSVLVKAVCVLLQTILIGLAVLVFMQMRPKEWKVWALVALGYVLAALSFWLLWPRPSTQTISFFLAILILSTLFGYLNLEKGEEKEKQKKLPSKKKK